MKKMMGIGIVVLFLISAVQIAPAKTLNNPPEKPTITGPTSGEAGKSYTYTAVSTDPDGDKIFYCFDWGDGNELCTNLFNSGQQASASHTWKNEGDYTITVKATDENGAESEPATLRVSMPLEYANKPSSFSPYTGTLRVYIVEPVSRWKDNDKDPYHFGFLDFAFNDALNIPYGDTHIEEITWNPGQAGYPDAMENNIMAIAAVFNPQVHNGHADPPFGNPFDSYYVDACAAAKPGETGQNVKDENFTHTVFCEEGTATWCPYCPAMSNALYSIYESHDYPFYFVALIADKNSVADNRLDEYNLAGYPTAFFDGGKKVVIGGYTSETPYRSAIRSCATRDVHDLDLTIETEWVNNALQITVSITNNEQEDFIPPEVSIVKPKEGYLYFMDKEIMKNPLGRTIIVGKVTLEATATDESGIEKVEFLVCGDVVFTATEEPYEFLYDGTYGGHTLQVIAYDKAGNSEEDVLGVYVINL